LIGAGTPFEQTRPGTSNKLADSASANDAFSIACHPPKTLTSGSVAIAGCLLGGRSKAPGFSYCGRNTTLAAVYTTPCMSWFKVA
jgi:hypothetical protein